MNFSYLELPFFTPTAEAQLNWQDRQECNQVKPFISRKTN